MSVEALEVILSMQNYQEPVGSKAFTRVYIVQYVFHNGV
jgi:hypothetical protein